MVAGGGADRKNPVDRWLAASGVALLLHDYGLTFPLESSQQRIFHGISSSGKRSHDFRAIASEDVHSK